MHAILYDFDQPPTSLALILEGSCKVCRRGHPGPAAVLTQHINTPPAQGGKLPYEPATALLLAKAGEQGGGGVHTNASNWLGDDGVVAATAAAAAALRRRLMGSPRKMEDRLLEVAVLGPGDLVGEALVLGQGRHSSSVVVSSGSATILRLDKKDVHRIWHPSDLKLLKERLQQREERREASAAAAAASGGRGGLLQMPKVPVRAESEAAAAGRAAGCVRKGGQQGSGEGGRVGTPSAALACGSVAVMSPRFGQEYRHEWEQSQVGRRKALCGGGSAAVLDKGGGGSPNAAMQRCMCCICTVTHAVEDVG